MQLPKRLLRNKSNVHKNNFGHVLILAGSPRMLGAGALCSLAAMRSGAGLVTLGIPKSLNLTAQKKIDNSIMTLPLTETSEQTLSITAFSTIKNLYKNYSSIAIGPGLSLNPSTQRLILKIIQSSPIPLVIDADALISISKDLNILNQNSITKILTPHPGEMAKLINQKKETIELNRKEITKNFVKKHNCTLILKGNKTIVAENKKRIYTNTTGNAGMATAGSGDVLAGMIAAFLAQGITSFESAKIAVYLHGKAGDIAATNKTKESMIATDIIDFIPKAITLGKKNIKT